jgi:hypothetical protein
LGDPVFHGVAFIKSKTQYR